MNIIMNKNLKKRLMSCHDAYLLKKVSLPSNLYVSRDGTGITVSSWYAQPDAPIKTIIRNPLYNSFRRKFAKYKVSLLSGQNTIYMKEYLTNNGSYELYTGSYRSNDRSIPYKTISVAIYGIDKTSNEGILDSGFSITGTDDGGVQLSLIKPYDVKPTQIGVNIDSFKIEFFDDFDRPTAIVTGTIGDLNSTADVKMANTLIEDGAYINISGMDDFLITTPNTIAISN